MSSSGSECENSFEVDKETVAALQELENEDLQAFAAMPDSFLDDGQCKASSYAYFLLFKRKGSTSDLEKGIKLVNQWLDHKLEANSRRECPSRILEIFSTQLAKEKRASQVSQSLGNSRQELQNQLFSGPSTQLGSITEMNGFRALDGLFQGMRLNNVGMELLQNFNNNDSLDDLNNAILFVEMAVEEAFHRPTRALRMTNLSGCYGTRFERTGCTEDLERAIELSQKAANIKPRDPLELADSFTGLEIWLSKRFERFGRDDDLRKAIHAVEMAVELTPDDHPHLPGRLNDYANRLSTRFEQGKCEGDLIKAIELLEKALGNKTKLSNNDKAVYLNNLGLRLYELFRKRSSVNDLARALKVAQESVDIAFPEDRSVLPNYLNNLSLIHHAHFEHFGILEHLDKAIEHVGTAIDKTPHDHPDLIPRIKNLGLWLRSRSWYTGSLDDINRSIDAIESAIRKFPTGHPLHAEYWSDLSCSYNDRFDRSSSITDLEASLKYGKQATEFLPRNPSKFPGILNNYSNTLAKYARETGMADALHEAIKNIRAAIKDTPPGDADRPSRFCNLGDFLGHLFRINPSREYIDEAISLTKESSNMLSREHLDRAGYLLNLGTWYSERFEKFGDHQDQLDALSSYKIGSKIATATPSVRIELAFRAARIYADKEEWGEASKLLGSAIDLFPAISLRSLKHTDKQDMLGRFFGLASDAAAISLNAGDMPYHALLLLERGRGVIAGLLMDMRGDISDLETRYPDLAKEFCTLRDQLTIPAGQWNLSPSNRNVVAYDDRVRERREADRDFNSLISKIRNETELIHFLSLPPEEELMIAARSGPIVVVNTSRYRCDAFLIQNDKIHVQRLNGLKIADMQKHVQVLHKSSPRSYDTMKTLLNWLWDTITAPCLNALGCEKSPVPDLLPHVWWVPTGHLSRLPLHAAGNYREDPYDSVLDRVMSSYAVSVKALMHGRQAIIPESSKSPQNALLIPMKTTPDLDFRGDLDFAEHEVDMLKDMCKPLGLLPVTPEPRKDDILRYVKTCKVFHFAGHGSSDPVEPSKSCLLLKDWKSNPLTVEDFRDYHIDENPPFLGYLSACSTGANTVVKLADEGIHLISSLQLAGFRHVVGTLWEVSDMYCVDVARVFYETLQDEGMTDISICRALHKAVKAFRDGQMSIGTKLRFAICVDFNESTTGPESFHWVPYIHFGY